ncbi:hypothetical protein HBE96_03560 [Clostridium sp. P21]|uniref:Uncharacterized protein n=1 Tax=Clostridium muellerianum TaxID=2716538 RepID=A0A7Y0EE19_9CLOT|nr:hypothetical protein [Clostridium muellerianum]NMM61779.1 hypothetical protein [Clostridium muellerianum]
MIKLKAFLGYVAAVLALFVVLATFIGNDFLAKKFAYITSLKVSPLYTGGEVYKTLSFKDSQIKIHKPVFQGLFSDRSKGFVEVDYESKNTPDIISQNIDFDDDGKDDFSIKYNPQNNTSEFKSLNKNVVSLKGIYKIKSGYAIRVNLKK